MDLDDLLSRLAHQRGVLVTVHAVQGSGPREVGAWMAVFSSPGRSQDEKAAPSGGSGSHEVGERGGYVLGSVGGGHLEWQAIAHARQILAQDQPASAQVQRYALGPSLGQCCGGVVQLRFEPIDARSSQALRSRLDKTGTPVALFGGGHVGKALIKLLGDLPFDVTWIDSRDEIFPAGLPGNVRCEHSDPVQAAVADLTPGSSVLIMSFSHAEDLGIVAACLMRQRARGDLGFIGLIGSKTKWATFRHRLAERGFSVGELAAVTCPIGLPGIKGKEPAVVALAAAAQLMQTLAL